MCKILIVSQYPSRHKPAYFSFVRSRVEVLERRYSVSVLSMRYVQGLYGTRLRKDESESNFCGHPRYYLEVGALPIPKVRVLAGEWWMRRALPEILCLLVPDIVHAHFSSGYSWLISDACLRTHIPMVLTEHASFFDDYMLRPIGKRMRRGLCAASTLITVSQDMAVRIKTHTGRTAHIIPNPVNMDLFTLPESRPQNTIPELISVGSFNENDKKGYRLLVEAACSLLHAGKRFRLSIHGDGPLHGELTEMIRDAGFQEYIYLPGRIANHELPPCFWAADFCVLSSRIEPFGVVLVEAMASGLPVVATRSGGPEEIVTQECGILVEKNSVDALIDGIERMLRTYDKFSPATIRKNAVSRFGYDTYAKLVFPIYDALL